MSLAAKMKGSSRRTKTSVPPKVERLGPRCHIAMDVGIARFVSGTHRARSASPFLSEHVMAEVPVTQSNTVELPDSTRVVEQNRGSGDVGSSDSARRRNSGDQTERAPRIRTVVRTRRIYVRPCTADSKVCRYEGSTTAIQVLPLVLN